VIAILDSRLRTKGYGKDFLNSLPRCKITIELKDVAQIFGGETNGSSFVRRNY